MAFITSELNIFLIQQSVHHLIVQRIDSVNFISIVIIFMGGVFTSFNPCMLSTVPWVLLYMSNKKASQLSYLNFILGLVLSTVIVSSVFMTIKYSALHIVQIVPIIKPCFLIIIGFSLLQLINISEIITNLLPEYSQNIDITQSFFLIGFLLGVTLSSCSAPIFMTVLAWITYTQQLSTGFLFLSIYLLGYIIFPLCISIISIHLITSIQLFIMQLYKLVLFCGFLLTTLGMFSIFHLGFNQLLIL